MGNTYTNNWVAPTYMVSVEDSSLRGGGRGLKQKIWDAARDTIQEWTGEELTECSLYGIRVYTAGSVLASHVDRLPLVSSAIINVAQDVDEPWMLEVIGHNGKASNVTMEPGDMVLYESHSVIHGRPFPLKGRYYANIFIHFEPTGHSLRHNAKVEGESSVHEKYREATSRGAGGHEVDQAGGLPSYIIPGTPEEGNWRARHPNGQVRFVLIHWIILTVVVLTIFGKCRDRSETRPRRERRAHTRQLRREISQAWPWHWKRTKVF
jgi:prolyl 4-hydroxylase